MFDLGGMLRTWMGEVVVETLDRGCRLGWWADYED